MLYFWVSFCCTYFLFLPLAILRVLNRRAEEEVFVQRVVSRYCMHLFTLFGVQLQVDGLERLPRTRRICFVANHQGMADVALIEAALPMRIGFIAKRELERVPLLAAWLRALSCVTIERANPRKARETIARGARNIAAGKPMVLFPEGTRSRKGEMGPFLPGSMLLPISAGAVIVPLSIDGTYRIVEERMQITPGKVRLVIHDPLDASRYSPRQRRELADRLWELVHSGLTRADRTYRASDNKA